MRGRRKNWKTSRRSSPGSTLAEMLAALALLSVVSAIGMGAIRSTVRAAARCLEEARWNGSVLLFDRVVRRGIADLPAAFWAPPPRVGRGLDGELVVEERGGGSRAVRITREGEVLEVTTPELKLRFRGILSAAAEELRASDGRVAGVRIELVSARHRQEFLVAWKGQRL